MLNQSFEIKVALLGHVSVGKTTLLNALLGDKFGEVSRKRTTAGVNFFQISFASEGNDSAQSSEEGDTTNGTKKSKEVLNEITKDNEILRKSNTLQERYFDVTLDKPLMEMRNDTSLTLVDIPGINEAHTEKMYLDYVKKVWTDLDCVVVVMDAALGVNGEEQIKLLRFVKENITDLKDIPVVVLCNKVDDPDDVEIKGMVEEVGREVVRIFDEKKADTSSTGKTKFGFGPAPAPSPFVGGAAPVPAPGPTAPTPFGGGAAAPPPLPFGGGTAAPAPSPFSAGGSAPAPSPFRSAPAPNFSNALKIGGTPSAKSAGGSFSFGNMGTFPPPAFKTDAPAPLKIAKEMSEQGNTDSNSKNNVPTFLPISAENAFLYRSATKLLLDDSYELDHAYLEKIGHEEIGKYKWKQLSDSKKRELVCNVVSDPAQYKERLEASNFDSFINALQSCLGGKDNQTRIIGKQIEVELKGLSTSDGITVPISKIHDRCVALGKQTDYLKEKFWSLIEASTVKALGELREDPTKVDGLHVPMNELIMYANGLHAKLHTSLSDQARKYDEDRIEKAMRKLIQKQIHMILGRGINWTADGRKVRNLQLNQARSANPPLTQWCDMTPRDWSTIISSVLMLSRNEHFFTRFGQELADLEWIKSSGPMFRSDLVSIYAGQCEKGQYMHGKFVPDDPHKYAMVVQLKVPASIEDTSHWGNLAWMYCKFMDFRR